MVYSATLLAAGAISSTNAGGAVFFPNSTCSQHLLSQLAAVHMKRRGSAVAAIPPRHLDCRRPQLVRNASLSLASLPPLLKTGTDFLDAGCRRPSATGHCLPPRQFNRRKHDPNIYDGRFSCRLTFRWTERPVSIHGPPRRRPSQLAVQSSRPWGRPVQRHSREWQNADDIFHRIRRPFRVHDFVWHPNDMLRDRRTAG
jgi:hypothetical protein